MLSGPTSRKKNAAKRLIDRKLLETEIPATGLAASPVSLKVN